MRPWTTDEETQIQDMCERVAKEGAGYIVPKMLQAQHRDLDYVRAMRRGGTLNVSKSYRRNMVRSMRARREVFARTGTPVPEGWEL